jgi:holliday junction DNA helicase RuvA
VIASVSGRVLVRRPDHVVVEASGVGYRLTVSSETLRAVPAIGNDVALHAHLIARDDSMSLYGFASEEERDLFLMLISVSGIGPKVGIAALSGGAVRDLLTAIAAGDAKRFQAVPGIGKRTAERIIVELREKVAGELGDALAASDAPAGASGRNEARTEARDGLLGLGYTPLEAERLLDLAEGETAEELINAAIKAGASGSAGSADRSAA